MRRALGARAGGGAVVITEQFLKHISGKPPAAQVQAIDDALWGETVDPHSRTTPEQIAMLKTRRLEMLRDAMPKRRK